MFIQDSAEIPLQIFLMPQELKQVSAIKFLVKWNGDIQLYGG